MSVGRPVVREHVGKCVTGCGRYPSYARGLCRRCYNRAKKDGTLVQHKRSKVGRKPGNLLCEVDGCKRLHYSGGYCQMHYRRVQRRGSAGGVLSNREEKAVRKRGGDMITLEPARFMPGIAAALALPTEVQRVDRLLELRR